MLFVWLYLAVAALVLVLLVVAHMLDAGAGFFNKVNARYIGTIVFTAIVWPVALLAILYSMITRKT